VDGGVLQTYKPGSVPLPEGRAVTIYLAQPPAVKPAEVRFWRSGVTAAVKQPTRGRAGRLSPPIWPCSRWGLAAAASPQTAGRSYRPISPLSFPYGEDGMFLCHFPFPMQVLRTGIGTWELPSTLPRGARTFLPPPHAGRTAVTQSAWPSVSNFSIGHISGANGGCSRVDIHISRAIKNGRLYRPFTFSGRCPTYPGKSMRPQLLQRTTWCPPRTRCCWCVGRDILQPWQSPRSTLATANPPLDFRSNSYCWSDEGSRPSVSLDR